jgi:beta-lactam-binding protein with PASTA domain
LINMSDSDARNKIVQVGGRVGTVTHQPSSAPLDSVISQSVEADAVTVDIVESDGDANVPNVLGDEEDGAKTRIQQAGLVVGTDTHVNDCKSPGDVEMQDPIGGAGANRGDRVNIWVSTCTGGGIPK